MIPFLAQLGSRTAGIILLALSAIVTLSAAWLIWSSIARWEAIASINAYHIAILARADKDAQTLAREAASELPQNPVTALPMLDLSRDQDAQSLARLSVQATARQRHLLETAAALSEVLAGRPPGDVTGDDGVLLRYLAALPRSGPAAAPTLTDGDPPQRGILALTLQRRFRAAWAAGDGDAVRAAAGPLLLLDPRQPDASRLRAILYAADPQITPTRLQTAITDALSDIKSRVAFVRQLCVLLPKRSADLVAIIPAGQQTPDEHRLGASTNTGTLDEQVRFAIDHPDQALVETLLPRALALGRGDQARLLFNLLTADRKPPFALAVATLEGDVESVIALSGDLPELHPQISPPIIADGTMTFQLATPSGLLPHARIDLRIDGRPVSESAISRVASLVSVNIGTMKGPYELRLGSRLVASGKLTP